MVLKRMSTEHEDTRTMPMGRPSLHTHAHTRTHVTHLMSLPCIGSVFACTSVSSKSSTTYAGVTMHYERGLGFRMMRMCKQGVEMEGLYCETREGGACSGGLVVDVAFGALGGALGGGRGGRGGGMMTVVAAVITTELKTSTNDHELNHLAHESEGIAFFITLLRCRHSVESKPNSSIEKNRKGTRKSKDESCRNFRGAIPPIRQAPAHPRCPWCSRSRHRPRHHHRRRRHQQQQHQQRAEQQQQQPRWVTWRLISWGRRICS
jgi:hypothetical protein